MALYWTDVLKIMPTQERFLLFVGMTFYMKLFVVNYILFHCSMCVVKKRLPTLVLATEIDARIISFKGLNVTFVDYSLE